ncbi:MAG: ABC transporter ATP-binding protein [Chloroflexi bacterium]|nr:ABC transporter ATP-binding protein [Chloroflexota bacterium]
MAADGRTPVLTVRNLGVSYRTNGGWVSAVRDFQIEICPGQIYGLVGESGSGKTTAARGILNYLPPNGRIEPGSEVRLLDESLCGQPRHVMQKIWGRLMGFVPQHPGQALNPSIRVGEQVAEALRQHRGLGRAEAEREVIEALRRVNLADPERMIRRYPHELSGGQQQRIMIAMALITSPHMLILDEPTTSLDVTTEAVILDLVRDLITGQDTAALYVTHDLGVVAQLCQRVTVLYVGEIMEDASVEELFETPLHPYTIGLLNSIPRLGATKRDRPLPSIPGRPPSLSNRPPGCVFEPRCPIALEVCKTKPPLEAPGEGRLVRCHRWREIAAGDIPRETMYKQPREGAIADDLHRKRPVLMEVRELTKHFRERRSLGEVLRGEERRVVRAVNGVNLTVRRGRTYGLVGESGSGKTTLARMIIGLPDRTSGEIELLGADVKGTVRDRTPEMLAQIQMVFQNPQNTLNPYLSVGQAIRRPLMKLGGLSRREAEREVGRLLAAVNLRPEYAHRYPHELSGGEKQRVAIARAFASNPALVLCDEPVTSLDVSVQAAVLNLLARLQEENEASYIFISHNLAVVSYLADYIAVMYRGSIMEVGYAHDLFTPPMHPYTEALVSAIPVADPNRQTTSVRLEGPPPSPREVVRGCPFHTRCPRKIGRICEEETPPWRDCGEDHHIYCHIPLDELIEMQKVGNQREQESGET